MSISGDDISGIVGTAVLGAVALKSIEVVGNVAGNVANEPKKKKKKSKSKQNDIFSMENVYGQKKSGSKKKKSNNIFDMGGF